MEAEPDANPSPVPPPEQVAGLPDGQHAQQSAQEQLDDRPELRADAEAGQNFECGHLMAAGHSVGFGQSAGMQLTFSFPTADLDHTADIQIHSCECPAAMLWPLAAMLWIGEHQMSIE